MNGYRLIASIEHNVLTCPFLPTLLCPVKHPNHEMLATNGHSEDGIARFAKIMFFQKELSFFSWLLYFGFTYAMANAYNFIE